MHWLNSVSGGVLIGIAVSWMLFSIGRVTGISGIISSSLFKIRRQPWQIFFLLGLIAGGILLKFLNPDFFLNTVDRSLSVTIVAGLLVGIGTSFANGCTSGHGICGLSRFSSRSFFATITFMAFGALTVYLYSRVL